MSSSDTVADRWKWLLSELLKVFTSPLSVASSLLDAARGWRYSRNWVLFFFSLPAFLVLAAVYLAYGFSLFERIDTRVQRYGVKSEQVCSTQFLEAVAYRKIDFIRDRSSPSISSKFDSPAGISGIQNLDSTEKELSELKIRYIRLLNERILLTQPTDGSARYRLALLNAIVGDRDIALEQMRALASDETRPFPAASSWVATELIDRLKKTPSAALEAEVVRYLKPASLWPGVRPQVLEYYAELLFKRDMTNDAIAVAQEAAKRDRSYNLLLMRYYSKLGNSEGVKTAGYEVDAFFRPRLNTSLETVSDRLTLVEASFLLNKPETALSIVEEGLAKATGDDRKSLARALSDIKVKLFLESKVQQEDGSFQADLSLLDQAADADPDNPVVSLEVAKMLQNKIKPTRKLLMALKRQIDTGVTTSETHRILAIGYHLSGNTEEAIRNFEYAIEKSKIDPDSRNNLAILLARQTNPDLPRAIKLIEEALALVPNNPSYLDTYGQILIAAGRTVEAIPKLERALAVGVDVDDFAKLQVHVNTRKRLLTAYRELGMTELADAQEPIIRRLEGILAEKVKESSMEDVETKASESTNISGK